jgi:hypothetical protein
MQAAFVKEQDLAGAGIISTWVDAGFMTPLDWSITMDASVGWLLADLWESY